MSLNERRCPSCGGNQIKKVDDTYQCMNCGAILTDSNETKTTNVHIFRDEAKIENIRRKERRDRQEENEKKMCFKIGIVVSILVVLSISAHVILGPWLEVPVSSSADYKDKDKDIVVSSLKDAGFWNVVAEPLNDLSPKNLSQENLVSYVTVAGDDTWVYGIFRSKKEYGRLSPVKVYYHSLNPDAVIDAPEGNGNAYTGMDYQIVEKKIEEAGFSNILLQPLHDLESNDDEKNGKTDRVTINEEIEWSTGFLQLQRKQYKRSDKVIIYYHSK